MPQTPDHTLEDKLRSKLWTSRTVAKVFRYNAEGSLAAAIESLGLTVEKVVSGKAKYSRIPSDYGGAAPSNYLGQGVSVTQEFAYVLTDKDGGRATVTGIVQSETWEPTTDALYKGRVTLRKIGLVAGDNTHLMDLSAIK